MRFLPNKGKYQEERNGGYKMNHNLISHLRHVGFAMPQLQEQLDFYSWDNANMYYEAVEVYEETPDIKVWRQVTKLY